MQEYIKQADLVKSKSNFIFKRLSGAEFEEELGRAVSHLLEKDKTLSEVIQTVGSCRLKPRKKYFETLVDAILSQQLSLRAAETIFNRFKSLFNVDGSRKFPSPEQILITDDVELRKCGLSNAKVKYVKDLSAKVINGTIKIHKLGSLPDEEIINELTQVKGIGVWTVHMFLIFCLARLDVLPVGDLGFKKAVMINYKLRKFPSEKKVTEVARKYSWQPYRSVAAWYHWQSLTLKQK